MPLKDNDPQKWMASEHTKVKHKILKKYLETWIKILGKNPKICYFDCFAGRGIYADGYEGSPLIGLKAARDIKEKNEYIKEIELTFIEKDKENYDNLINVVESEIQQNKNQYKGIRVLPFNDEFDNVSEKIINECKNNSRPSFFFIDPFGIKGLPFKTIQKILSIPKTEVFINFMLREVNRFKGSQNHLHSIEELYGFHDPKGIIESKYKDLHPEDALLKLYRKQLHNAADVNFTFPFKVNADKKLQTTYYLIHATNNIMGAEIMKDIMWNEGTEGRFGYFGPAEGQMVINSFNKGDDLKEYLFSRFSGLKKTYIEIREETVSDVPYRLRDYRDALKELHFERRILIENLGLAERRKIQDNALINFDPELAEKTLGSVNEMIVEAKKNPQSSLFDF